jgi:tetratricopeptide (TPR) repeat protein
VAICAQERLPRISDPVLLSLDADFFPHAARYRGVTVLTEIRALLSALRDARYAVRDAVVAHSVQDGAVPIELRWAGEAVVEMLRDPSIALQEEPPERWSALQRLTLLKAGGQAKAGELLNVALSLLQRQPHDPALLLFAAEAAAGHGGGDAALAYAEQACRVDRGYCVGLREVGLQLLERGAVDDAAPFFAAAERLLPGMSYGQLDEGILLAKAGRLVEAVATLEKLIAREGAFPVAFLVGAIHVASGDRAAARRSYDLALAALAQSPYAAVTREETAGAIRGAAIFYRDEGLVAQAELLVRDVRLRPSPDGAGP